MSLANTHLVNLSLFLQRLLAFPTGNLLARKTNERTRETERQKEQTTGIGNGKKKEKEEREGWRDRQIDRQRERGECLR